MKSDLSKTHNCLRFYSGLLVFCASIFLWPKSSAAEPFTAPGANVLLLSGLPGDLESETYYRDQVRSWLEILQTAAPHSIHLLADSPGDVAAGIDARTASRSNFLSVAHLLQGQTNSLIFIAWGHGGKQGSTPVFHVRGPRITIADFGLLATNGPPESRWLLFFRGSGIFARELATASRQIISSDAEAAFSSDPIGLSLAAKIVRRHPAIEWTMLADELGAGISAWYTDRNLARTEEPALWVGEEHPKLLARTTRENTLSASEPEEKATTPADAASQANQPPDNTPAAALTETPSAAWKDIKRVQPGDFPETDAVLLRRQVTYTLGSAPAISSEQDEFIQVLTAEGKRFGDFDISYSPPAEDITFLNCEVQRPDGGVLSLDPDAIREARDESLGEYQMGRRKFFSLPGVAPGAVLHVRYRTVWKQFPLPYISLQIPLAREIPIVDLTVEVTAPKDAPFHFGFEGAPEKEPAYAEPRATSELHTALVTNHEPVVSQTTYGATYTWHFEKVAAETRESLTAPHHGSRLMLSTFPDWNTFAQWYARISRLTDEVTPMISAKAAELTKDAASEREKVLALYNFVTGLRYVAVPLGVNSFRPHAAEHVLQNQFGDCKDKANLFNALLHSMNITADLVLVPRFTQAHENLPGFAFNHAISRVILDGKMLWVDTTDDVCRFGLLPPGDPGRRVLVIAPGTNTLTQLPIPEASEHRLQLTGEIDCSDPAAGCTGSFNLIAFGYPDYELRETARETKEGNSSLPLLSARFLPSAGTFALQKQSATSIAALDQNFAWKGQGTLIGISSKNVNTSERRAETIRAPFWLPKEWDLALHRRSSPLFLNQGYPLTLEESLDFRLSADTTGVVLPPGSANEQGPLRWRVKWNKGQDRLTASLGAELAKGELNDSETRSVQQQLRALLAALAETAMISR